MMVALFAGLFQFLPNLRRRAPRLHRITGRVYVACALVGTLAGLYLAPHSASGLVSDVGFALLALGTLVTTGLGLLTIRRRQLAAHRAWMTRSFALIFAGVTLRLELTPIEQLLGEQTGYALVAWLCWAPNLLVAEWLLRRRSTARGALPAPLDIAA